VGRGRESGGFMQKWFSEEHPLFVKVGFQNVSKNEVRQFYKTSKLFGEKPQRVRFGRSVCRYMVTGRSNRVWIARTYWEKLASFHKYCNVNKGEASPKR
jgi:hypothetical protein